MFKFIVFSVVTQNVLTIKAIASLVLTGKDDTRVLEDAKHDAIAAFKETHAGQCVVRYLRKQLTK